MIWYGPLRKSRVTCLKHYPVLVRPGTSEAPMSCLSRCIEKTGQERLDESDNLLGVDMASGNFELSFEQSDGYGLASALHL